MYFYDGSMWRNDHLTLAGCEIGEERKWEESAGNFKLAAHRVLDIEVTELSIRYIQFSFLRFFVFYIFSFLSYALFVTEGHCVYHRADWPCPINHNNTHTHNVIITAERALHGHIANKRRKWADLIVWFVAGMITWIFVYWRKVHLSFGLLEEGSREFWFIGGRYTWVLVSWRKVRVRFFYWRKVHVCFGLLEEGTREFWFIGGRYTWVLVCWRKAHVSFGLLEEESREICWWSRYGSWNDHHWCVCTDFLASIFTEYTYISLFFEGCI